MSRVDPDILTYGIVLCFSFCLDPLPKPQTVAAAAEKRAWRAWAPHSGSAARGRHKRAECGGSA